MRPIRGPVIAPRARHSHLFAVPTGFEPATPAVTGRYANQLRYETV